MRKYLITSGIVAVVAIVAGPAIAGGKVSTVTGSIELASASRVASDGAKSARYGDAVAFATNVEGRLAKNSTVYVTVVCIQDGRVVYQWSADPGFTFPLEDQAGLDWNGGAASCSATLIYRIDRREDIVTWLDQTTFEVAA